MILKLTSKEEATKLLYYVLNQGDSRYNNSKEEFLLASAILDGAVSLEKKDIPNITDLINEKFEKISNPQKKEKTIAKALLKNVGFKEEEIYFERMFLGSRPDVLGEKDNSIIPVECCSCRVNKIIDYLNYVQEVWILTRTNLNGLFLGKGRIGVKL